MTTINLILTAAVATLLVDRVVISYELRVLNGKIGGLKKNWEENWTYLGNWIDQEFSETESRVITYAKKLSDSVKADVEVVSDKTEAVSATLKHSVGVALESLHKRVGDLESGSSDTPPERPATVSLATDGVSKTSQS